MSARVKLGYEHAPSCAAFAVSQSKDRLRTSEFDCRDARRFEREREGRDLLSLVWVVVRVGVIAELDTVPFSCHLGDDLDLGGGDYGFDPGCPC